MDNASLVEVVQRLKQVLHDTDSILFLVKSFGLYSFEEFSTFKIFKYQVNVFVTLVHFVQLDDVVMLYLSQYVYLK